MRVFCAFLLVAVLATVSQGDFEFDLTSGLEGEGCVFNVKSTSDIFAYYLGIKVTEGTGTISTNGITWPDPALFDFPGHKVTNSNYDYAFAASQFPGSPSVGANTLVFGIGFDNSDSIPYAPYTIELYDINASGTIVDTISYVPEPAMVSLMALGCLGLKRRKKS